MISRLLAVETLGKATRRASISRGDNDIGTGPPEHGTGKVKSAFGYDALFSRAHRLSHGEPGSAFLHDALGRRRTFQPPPPAGQAVFSVRPIRDAQGYKSARATKAYNFQSKIVVRGWTVEDVRSKAVLPLEWLVYYTPVISKQTADQSAK
jgi:hypothetical protein